MSDDRYTIRRPAPGRPSDRRVDSEYIALRPELTGLEPFDPAQDVDIADEVERVIGNVRADVAFADPALGEALTTTLNVTLPAKVAQADAATQAAEAQATRAEQIAADAAALQSAVNLADQLYQIENGMLALNGYAVGVREGRRTLRAATGGPLILRTNADGTTTILGDPTQFTATQTAADVRLVRN